MGLGKTLTLIALIMTNHFDGCPLAEPAPGVQSQVTAGNLPAQPPVQVIQRQAGAAVNLPAQPPVPDIQRHAAVNTQE